MKAIVVFAFALCILYQLLTISSACKCGHGCCCCKNHLHGDCGCGGCGQLCGTLILKHAPSPCCSCQCCSPCCPPSVIGIPILSHLGKCSKCGGHCGGCCDY